MPKMTRQMMNKLSLHPVHTLNAGHIAKVLHVVGDYCQTIVPGSNSNENVKITSFQTLLCKGLANIHIVVNPSFRNRKHLEIFLYNVRFFHVLLNITTMYGTVCKFCYRNFGSKYFLFCSLRDVNTYSTAMMEIFNPSIGIKNISFHKTLIVIVKLTVKRTTIVTMLHHLIILFTFFRFRPYSLHFKESGHIIIFLGSISCFGFFFRHNQLVCQPLTVTLRKRKPLQIRP